MGRHETELENRFKQDPLRALSDCEGLIIDGDNDSAKIIFGVAARYVISDPAAVNLYQTLYAEKFGKPQFGLVQRCSGWGSSHDGVAVRVSEDGSPVKVKDDYFGRIEHKEVVGDVLCTYCKPYVEAENMARENGWKR
ncbi:hypothetical protein HYV88_02815 [Candidatus Woesearchaeota archaeon]|nr:hypothetical protein [Candidatus Woesearchaeota archaeon]